jgi:hypothetical protein
MSSRPHTDNPAKIGSRIGHNVRYKQLVTTSGNEVSRVLCRDCSPPMIAMQIPCTRTITHNGNLHYFSQCSRQQKQSLFKVRFPSVQWIFQASAMKSCLVIFVKVTYVVWKPFLIITICVFYFTYTSLHYTGKDIIGLQFLDNFWQDSVVRFWAFDDKKTYAHITTFTS